jgi:3-deoxy-manno-octulosonate cytidylyltransferase (CMP-KDO synthetase)
VRAIGYVTIKNFDTASMKTKKQVLGIIPARYDSSRFPGKPLTDIGGKSMIRRVYEQAVASSVLDHVVIATDDARIYDHARSFGAEALYTRSTHPSGTDRCAEVAALLPGFAICINIQGDEPFLDPIQIEKVCRPLLEDRAQISTLALPIQDHESLFNPNIVKVVFNKNGHALYFSRSAIPFLRGVETAAWAGKAAHYRHLGLYGFQRETLLAVAGLPPSGLERLESLEQLRWLEYGYSIFIAITDKDSIGVDTPEDAQRANEWLRNRT